MVPSTISSASVFDAEPIGRGVKEYLADFGAGLPDRAAGLLHGKTAGRDALVGAAGCRGAHHLHAGDIDIEFVGGDLGERRHDALPDLDLSRRDRHLSLRRDVDPGRQLRVRREARRQFRRGGGGGLRRSWCAHLRRRAQHRPHHAVMRTASAQIAVERGLHVRRWSDLDFASTVRRRSSGCRIRNSRTAAPARR